MFLGWTGSACELELGLPRCVQPALADVPAAVNHHSDRQLDPPDDFYLLMTTVCTAPSTTHSFTTPPSLKSCQSLFHRAPSLSPSCRPCFLLLWFHTSGTKVPPGGLPDTALPIRVGAPIGTAGRTATVISIRRVSLGGGFRYLMESVAAGDRGSRPADGLAAYYTATGTPPGRFLGAGLADLGNGTGVDEDAPVGEDHLRRMLGEMCDPVTGDPVGQTPILSEKRVPVAGFDLTFSPSKSVSVAWALADPDTKAVIYDCHRRAVDFVVSYAEREVLRSRSGRRGIVEEEIAGVVAAAFTHWDSRAGDPQLHDHVIVWNRARSVSDGRWRTLDSRGLFKAAVMLSELHHGVLSDLLSERLGFGWEGRDRRHSDHRRYEVAGVPEILVDEFSRRSRQVEQRTTELVAGFVAAHGRHPSAVEGMRLAQQATLETRPTKAHRSLAEMTGDWRGRARPHVGSEQEQMAWVTGLAHRNDLPLLHSADLAEEILADAARAVCGAVSSRRATFGRHNVMAEALRIVHGVRFASPHERVAIAEQITALALDGSVLLGSPGINGAAASHRVYTTQEILDAEARLLDAGRRVDGPAVAGRVVAEAAEPRGTGRHQRLSVDQALAVEAIAASGRPLDVLIGPAGTGKSTTMAALRSAWEAQHGPGSVVGLAPSAAAARTLGTELGIATENTAKWLTEYRRLPELDARRRRLAATVAGHAAAGTVAGGRLRRQLHDLDARIESIRLRPGQLVIVDEASLAGTLALDELVGAADAVGAKVLLVGDPHQLCAVEAGGAFALLAGERGDLAPRLGEIRRFAHDWEKAASLQLRAGRQEAIDAYESHGRIVVAETDQLLEALYRAWKADVDAGRTSVMVAGDRDTVDQLNRRARADRVAAGEVAADGIETLDGQAVGAGDVVVTRRNDRRLGPPGCWVRNGDRWIVTAAHPDGALSVRAVGGGARAVLPASYAAGHVELAYATTVHQAQGRTVDTSHALVSPGTCREALYVAATRGRHVNRLYVDRYGQPGDDGADSGWVEHRSAREVLTAVLGHEAADVSAHEALRRNLAGPESPAMTPARGPRPPHGGWADPATTDPELHDGPVAL